MKTFTILITGGSGFLGGNLIVQISQRFNIYSTYNTVIPNFKNQTRLDITNEKEVFDILLEIKPDVIIHTAAMTNINKCFLDKVSCWKVNVEGTKNIVSAAEHIGSRLIYISTDMVYSGNESFYTETSEPKPICYYGKTKLEAEKIVGVSKLSYIIARVSLIYGLSKNNRKIFSEEIIKLLKQQRVIKLFTDEYRTPIYIDDLCKILFTLIDKSDLTGIFNISGDERVSRYEFGERLADLFGFSKKLLEPISIDDFNFLNKRPKDCSTSNLKIKKMLGAKFRTLDEGLLDMLIKFSKKTKIF